MDRNGAIFILMEDLGYLSSVGKRNHDIECLVCHVCHMLRGDPCRQKIDGDISRQHTKQQQSLQLLQLQQIDCFDVSPIMMIAAVKIAQSVINLLHPQFH